MPGSQFPVDAYENFVKQGVPRWTTNDDATIAAYIAEIDRVGPCIVMVHSQAGSFGFKVAQARPDKVKALIAVEPAGVGDPAKVDALKNVSDPDRLWGLYRSRFTLAEDARDRRRVCRRHQGRRPAVSMSSTCPRPASRAIRT